MSDIFLVMSGATADGGVLFGKNADRPGTEIQEVVYVPPSVNQAGDKVHCTFIEMDQAPQTYGAILSKPAWAWGAEMGANDQGVCIGNTSVWTKLCHPGDHLEKLIGVDFVRLGLERGKTAREALDVITGLLDQHGQGGLSSEDHNFSQWCYNNSFLIADRKQAWVLDTAGKFWAAKEITSQTYNLSSMLTIGEKFDVCSNGLQEQAKAEGFWKPEEGEFNFAKAFGDIFTGISLSDSQRAAARLEKGTQLLEAAVSKGKVTQDDIFKILRDEESSINFSGELQTMGSQVSLLSPEGSPSMDIHWFTATPNPNLSVFKPFLFAPTPCLGGYAMAPSFGDRVRASFQTAVDRRHGLYKSHEKAKELMEGEGTSKLRATMLHLEAQCVLDTKEFAQDMNDDKLQQLNDLFKDLCETEIRFYK